MNFKWRLLRPATLVLVVLCFVSTTAFLAFLPKFDFNPSAWLKRDVLAKLSKVRRMPYNRCPYPLCPISNDWNQSEFVYPFNVEDVCPSYFSYIHEDLAPWSTQFDAKSHPDHPLNYVNNQVNTANHQENDGNIITGISKEMLDNAKSLATFRVVIKRGKLYVNAYQHCQQTRAFFTIWGLLQLLKFYPGLVPDVDLLFECRDQPLVSKGLYKENAPPPPVFRYCSTVNHFDIPFPDWSFWGWAEIDLGPWDNELSGILKGGKDLLWEQRRPTAFWKGNTDTGQKLRKDLRSCNGAYYGAEIIHQDWNAAAKEHYKDSRLAQQCKNRYKVYAEGWAWSVSLKYILACDSPVLLVDPVYHEFFFRGLMPMKHFWPVRPDNVCSSIKFGVEWGNNNTLEAEALGRSGQQFMTKEVTMKHVYDYMLHALHEYAKLLRFEPKPTMWMTEVCAEEIVCRAPAERERGLYEDSAVKQASARPPCFLGPRDKKLIEARQQQKVSMTKLVQDAEDKGDWSAPRIISTPL